MHTPSGSIGRPAIPVRRLIPNLLTTVALCSGIASFHFSSKADWDRALAAIAIAAVFDGLDGRFARLLRVSTRFGATLDSLADFLSFGIAPAWLLHEWMLGDQTGRGWTGVFVLAAIVVYILCAAMRLARFTSARRVRSDSPWAGFFVGMPTPAAAGAVLIPPMLAASKIGFRLPDWCVIIVTFSIAWLMISHLPMFSFKRARINRRFVPPLLVLVGLLIVLATKDPWLTATLLAAAYLLTLPMSIVAFRRRFRDRGRAPRASSTPAPAQRAGAAESNGQGAGG